MNKLLPTFSVIIPTFNNALTVASAIRSVLTQTYPAHEIIVIDDGSTDGTREAVQEFGKSVTYIYQANSGVSTARNVGVEHASGQWIAFLDADDVYYQDRLRLHAEWIAEEPTLDFLLADQEARTLQNELLYSFMSASKYGKTLLDRHPSAQRIPLYEQSFRHLISEGFGEIRTLSVPREKFLKLGGFPVQHKIGEDLHLFIRLYASSHNAGIVPIVLAIYYIHEESALRKNPLSSMRRFVDALDSLNHELQLAPKAIKQAYAEKCRSARLSLAYSYLRVGQKKMAMRSVLPTFVSSPSLRTLKDLLSVCRGLSATAR